MMKAIRNFVRHVTGAVDLVEENEQLCKQIAALQLALERRTEEMDTQAMCALEIIGRLQDEKQVLIDLVESRSWEAN